MNKKINELDYIKNNYNLNKIYLDCNYNLDPVLVGNIIDSALYFESPDIISIVDDTVYAFEHFKFDSYKKNKKGSKYESKCGSFDNELYKEYVANNDNSITSKSIELKLPGSLINLRDNFIDSFVYHSNRIEKYRENIIKRTNISNIKFWFITEDGNPFGTFVNDENGHFFVFPSDIKEINNLLVSEKRIEGIIYAGFNGKNNALRVFHKNSYKNYTNFVDIDRKIECNSLIISSIIRNNS